MGGKSDIESRYAVRMHCLRACPYYVQYFFKGGAFQNFGENRLQ